MSQPPRPIIIDAGPGLNFFSLKKERLLIATLGPLSAPECVRDEILRKASQDNRFDAAKTVLSKLPDRLMQWLPDNPTPDLAAAVQRISGMPIAQRMHHSRDLGETMVIAHAAVTAEAGANVFVLIDDQEGARLATMESHRLARLRAAGRTVGSISLAGTLTVLEKAAGGEHIADRGQMRNLYQRLRGLDDGLPPIENTHLLAPKTWT